MTLNNLSTIVPFGVHGYYMIDSKSCTCTGTTGQEDRDGDCRPSPRVPARERTEQPRLSATA